MWTIKKKLCYILYWITAAWLPISRQSRIAKKIRWFWAKMIVEKIGNNVNIERCAVLSPKLQIGNNSGIGVNCEVYGSVIIGENVMMAPDVVIYTSSHKHDRIDVPMREQGMTECEPVLIGDDVWIGRRVVIMPGVKLGNGCIIGAGAVVTKNIPDYSVAVGVPAKVVKIRMDQKIGGYSN